MIQFKTISREVTLLSETTIFSGIKINFSISFQMCFEALVYYEFLKKINFNPSSYKDIANSLLENGVNEM